MANIIKALMGRVLGHLVAIPVGIVLSLAAVIILFSNEGRAVKTRRGLDEGAAVIVAISSDRVDPSHAGRLVHVQGRVSTEEVLTDPVFEVSTSALRLRRTVEMYQWNEREEQRRNSSGERSTHYEYDKKWSSRIIDARKFHQPGYENPKSMPYPSKEWAAQVFPLGAFRLGPVVREKVTQFTPLALTSTNVPAEVARTGFGRLHYSFYRGTNQLAPQIGDVRVAFENVEPQDVSVIAAQEGDTLQPYRTKAGGTIALLSTGSVSAVEMFRDAHWWNNVKMWLIRIGGVLLMVFGFQVALRPLIILQSLAPALLSWISFAAGFLGFLFAIAAALVVISLAWVVYRPVIAIPLLIGGAIAGVAILWQAASNRCRGPITTRRQTVSGVEQVRPAPRMGCRRRGIRARNKCPCRESTRQKPSPSFVPSPF